MTLAACLAFALSATAQTDDAKKITVTGSIQSDILIPQEDEAIGTGKYDDWGLTNTYAEARLRSKYVEAGARVEFMKFPLPGFENDFKGWGVPHFYVKGGVTWLSIDRNGPSGRIIVASGKAVGREPWQNTNHGLQFMTLHQKAWFPGSWV